MLFDFAKYVYREARPHPSEYNTVYYYRQGVVVAKSVGSGDIEYFTHAHPTTTGCVTDRSLDQLALQLARKEWEAKRNELKQLFIQDLLEDLNIADHLKKKRFLDTVEALVSEELEDGSEAYYRDFYRIAEKMVDFGWMGLNT
jgi:hypothetical protein